MAAKKENKKIIESIKTEAKEYYTWKNMVIRYIILWFLIILLIIQFIIPHKKKINNIEQTEQQIENTEIAQNNETIQNDEKDDSFSFLWEDFYPSEMDTISKIQFDQTINSLKNLEYTYALSQYYLPEIYNTFDEYGIPREFSYISILNNFKQPYRQIEKDLWEYYWLIISNEVDERLNTKRASTAISLYLSDLYYEFWDWNLVLLAYFMWPDELAQEMNWQWVQSFQDLFIPNEIKEQYTKILAYSYIFENIEEFINPNNIRFYKPKNTITVPVTEIKSLIRRAQKNKHSYKEIRELNPRILWNTLPKWNREIVIKNE